MFTQKKTITKEVELKLKNEEPIETFTMTEVTEVEGPLVVGNDGRIYLESAVNKYLTKKDTSPHTGEKLTVFKGYDTRALIESYKELKQIASSQIQKNEKLSAKLAVAESKLAELTEKKPGIIPPPAKGETESALETASLTTRHHQQELNELVLASTARRFLALNKLPDFKKEQLALNEAKKDWSKRVVREINTSKTK